MQVPLTKQALEEGVPFGEKEAQVRSSRRRGEAGVARQSPSTGAGGASRNVGRADALFAQPEQAVPLGSSVSRNVSVNLKLHSCQPLASCFRDVKRR